MWTCGSRGRPPAALLLGLPLLVVGPSPTQEMNVVSSEIAVSRDEASLRLELTGGRSLEVSFRDGTVYVDGEPAGSYVAGGSLEAAWRRLLGRAVSLDDGPLARALVEWAPPGDLPGTEREVAERVDRLLEEGLRGTAGAPGPGEAAPGTGVEGAVGRAVLRALARAGVVPNLADLLAEIDLERARIVAGQNVAVEEAEVVDGPLAVVGGDLDVRGTVHGDVLVWDGTLRVRDGGWIDGDVRLVDADLKREDGRITGAVRTVRLGEPGARARTVGERVESRIRERRVREVSLVRPFRHILQGLAGLLQTLVVYLVLAALGAALVFFARDRLETVADTARYATGRSAFVGAAAIFAALPAYVVGAIALAVSIVGIPVLLLWLPLFPVAFLVAALYGFLGTGHAVGEYLASQRYSGWEWLRRSNSYYYVFTGLAALLAAGAAAQVVRMGGPWLSFLYGILALVGFAVVAGAFTVGLGAVLLSRGGGRAHLAGVAPRVEAEPGAREEVG